MQLGDEDAAVTAVTLLAAYPFAVFYSAAYTEALVPADDHRRGVSLPPRRAAGGGVLGHRSPD